jgi:hypothetical protein
MKNRPFFSRKVSIAYIATVLLVQPYWVLEIYANFTYFNNINRIFEVTRPLEPLFRYGSRFCLYSLVLSLEVIEDKNRSAENLCLIVIRGGSTRPARCSTPLNAAIISASLNWSKSARGWVSCWLPCVSPLCLSSWIHSAFLGCSIAPLFPLGSSHSGRYVFDQT